MQIRTCNHQRFILWLSVATAIIVIGCLQCLVAVAQKQEQSCVPVEGFQSNQIAQRKTADGLLEATEYYSNGVYRVRQCNSEGDLKVAMTVAHIDAPNGEHPSLPIQITYGPASPEGQSELFIEYGSPNDPQWAEEWERHKKLALKRVIAPTDPSLLTEYHPPLISPLSAESIHNKCTRPTYRKAPDNAGTWWPSRGYSYYTNDSTFPTYVHGGVATARFDVIMGHKYWDQTHNVCGFKNYENTNMDWAGTTTESASGTDRQGINVIDFGPLEPWASWPGCSVAIACEQNFPDRATGQYAESHIRFDYHYVWTTQGSNEFIPSYNITNVATHEVGHTLGLGDLTNNDDMWLTMYSPYKPGRENLGDGDVQGMRAFYPR